jgi:hypothetical protein
MIGAFMSDIVISDNQKINDNNDNDNDNTPSTPSSNTKNIIKKTSIDLLSDDQFRIKLKQHINVKTENIIDKLQYVSLKYDIVKNMFNYYSLTILVVSALITFSGALKLLIIKYINDNDINIDSDNVDFSLNILTLSMGTYMTIISSVIRFRNYREKMEKLREMQDKFIHIKAQYGRELSIIALNKNETKSLLEEVQDKVQEYDQIIEEINMLSEITNEEMIQFEEKLSNYKISITKIKVDEKNKLRDQELKLKK